MSTMSLSLALLLVGEGGVGEASTGRKEEVTLASLRRTRSIRRARFLSSSREETSQGCENTSAEGHVDVGFVPQTLRPEERRA